MARGKKEHPQALAPYLTQHSADPGWPLVLIVDERGATRYACADCGAEIPDGVCVERDAGGRVVAYSPTRGVLPDTQPSMGADARGNQFLHVPAVEVGRVVLHECGGRRG